MQQGVVTYMPPVEAFATGIKVFDRQKVCLITRSFPFKAIAHLIFEGSKVKLQPHVPNLMILAAGRLL